MSDQITPEVFEHLVDLAALELDEKQAEYLRRQLNNQLKSIHELEAIPLDASLPVSLHGVPFEAAQSSTPRPDEWHPFADVKDILKQAPELEDGYIVVPDIPHTTLK
jgi:aspartyl-tRNA(Asn)/glutamyl-tRNA(Gln) amidotransferase subunit C